MAVKSTIYKAEIEISDIDRSYYATHQVTIAQHPSETDRRLMARLWAFAVLADERLEFGRGLGNHDDPDLWQRDLTGNIQRWIELGQPDESDIRKACGRAQQVVVITYSGNSAEVWWNKIAASLNRCKNLTVVDFDSEAIQSSTQLVQRSMRLQAMVQEGEVQLGDQETIFSLRPNIRMHSEK
jgi:uncharacterized protein YaeQ